MSRVSLALLLALGSITGVNCRSDVSRSTSPRLTRTAVAAQDAETAAVVDGVLDSAKHPWMHWPRISDVAPDVKPLYDSEPDRLLWFDDERPARVLGAHHRDDCEGRRLWARSHQTTTRPLSGTVGRR